jgi:hypothetical protein
MMLARCRPDIVSVKSSDKKAQVTRIGVGSVSVQCWADCKKTAKFWWSRVDEILIEPVCAQMVVYGANPYQRFRGEETVELTEALGQ